MPVPSTLLGSDHDLIEYIFSFNFVALPLPISEEFLKLFRQEAAIFGESDVV